MISTKIPIPVDFSSTLPVFLPGDKNSGWGVVFRSPFIAIRTKENIHRATYLQGRGKASFGQGLAGTSPPETAGWKDLTGTYRPDEAAARRNAGWLPTFRAGRAALGCTFPVRPNFCRARRGFSPRVLCASAPLRAKMKAGASHASGRLPLVANHRASPCYTPRGHER